jgi:hypothetical protein
VAGSLRNADGVTSGVGALARGGVAIRVLARCASDLIDALDRAWRRAPRAALRKS